MYVYVHAKELRWDILRPKKVTEKDDAPKSVNAVAPALCPWISELRGRQPTPDGTYASMFTQYK